MPGIFAVYKPKGPTSHDIIEELRKITGVKKIGHAGTLDPLAKGVLVVGIGRKATKKFGELVKKEKEYVAKIKLGAESTTDDEEGEKKIIRVLRPPSFKKIKEVVSSFEENIYQTPPVFSAVKVGGQKAYELARQGKKVKLKPKEVSIKKIEILRYEWPYLKLKIITGPGVYIRSLARDIGRKLKTGGYLFALERTRVGSFSKAVKLNQFRNYYKNR